MDTFRSLLACLVAGAVLAPASAAQIAVFPDEFERADVLAIERDGRDLLGFDAVSGRRSALRLEIDEEVLFESVRGRVGLVLTNRRAIALASGRGFAEARYRVSEAAPLRGLLGDRLALVVTSKRVLGFVEADGAWVDERLSPRERVDALRAGAAVGIVVTNRRALGLSGAHGRFISQSLQVREGLESVEAIDTLATLRTNRRILVFGALRAHWSERNREIR